MDRRITFKQQAKYFMHYATNRTRKPIKPATIRGFKCYLNKWLLPALGESLLLEINNGKLRPLVQSMIQSGLSSKSIDSYIRLVKLIMASAVDEDNGEPLYPRKWNADFIGMPVVRYAPQHALTVEMVYRILSKTEGQEQMLFLILAATGLRIGEALGLEIKHISNEHRTLVVEQSVWNGQVQSPKTQNAYRQVDLHSSVAESLWEFVGDRKEGFIFRSSTGRPLHQSNMLRRVLHKTLKESGSPQLGFHAFRRFRITHLRKSRCAEDLLRYWVGHSAVSLTDRYSKLYEDMKYRLEVVEHSGNGFDLPSARCVVNC
jgi:integrase